MMDINYNSATALQTFLADNGLGMRKKFGQNFLINPGVRQSLVNALSVQAGEGVWEIGPGLGAMTSLLLEQGVPVRAFEIDPGFARLLREIFSDNANFTLVEGDALKTWSSQPAEPYLLGNLPYNIASVLLADFIEKGRFFKRMLVTVQREVARRMAATPGSADYSSFSVLCASIYRVKPLMVIKGASFYPKPNVDSQAVLLEQNASAAATVRPACFYQLVRQLFSSRRKTIKNNLTGFFVKRLSAHNNKPRQGKAAEMAVQALTQCAGIDGGRRAEDLALEDFMVLAKTIEDMGI
jgi:16S rRNA (adenine1518-N6/adenine1519-N6)-dimethyltransferase